MKYHRVGNCDVNVLFVAAPVQKLGRGTFQHGHYRHVTIRISCSGMVKLYFVAERKPSYLKESQGGIIAFPHNDSDDAAASRYTNVMTDFFSLLFHSTLPTALPKCPRQETSKIHARHLVIPCSHFFALPWKDKQCNDDWLSGNRELESGEYHSATQEI
jgi:hypothetical protein